MPHSKADKNVGVTSTIADRKVGVTFHRMDWQRQGRGWARGGDAFSFTDGAVMIMLCGMNPDRFQIRRATVEDLDALRLLWSEARLPGAELEKRFKEFKVVVNDARAIIGAVGLQVVGQHGLIHSEAFLYPELEDALRPQLWERLLAVAHNFALLRFWTQEDTPFWRHYAGFRVAQPEEREQLPVIFGDAQQVWFTLRLREVSHGSPEAAVIEEQFLEMKLAQAADTERLRRHARRLKVLAVLVVLALLALVVLAGLYLIRRPPPG